MATNRANRCNKSWLAHYCDEEIENAALREFQEETGYTPKEIEFLGSYHKDTYMNAVWHVYLARGCTRTAGQKLEGEEQIEVRLVSIQELITNAKTDGMTDAVAVLMAYEKLMEINATQSDAHVRSL